ncbi:MAG TPA: hypothetical protein VNI57_05285 [Candidatus Saccharimonadales bacterium]|nr:hypothetical protein [Candidatus Saccharimonadales bacterium]
MRSPVSARTRWTIGAAAALSVVLLSAVPALADKLILFKNGKILHAEKVSVVNGWTIADMGKGNQVGVLTSEVASVQDAAGNSAGKDDLPNIASTENRGVDRGGGGASFDGGGGDDSSDRAMSVQERIQQRQEELAERRAEAADQAKDNQNDEGQNPAPGIIPGLRPLQQLNQGANLNRNRGFRTSRNVTGLQTPTPTPTPTQPQNQTLNPLQRRVGTTQRVVQPDPNDTDN